MKRAEFIRTKVGEYLDCVLPNPEIPGLGEMARGKVRNSYSVQTSLGPVRVMVTSDRVSAFDVVLDRAIPFKGVVLNAIAQHSFDEIKDLVDVAALPSLDMRVMIQREVENIGVECVVRGYMWGSLAKEYEEGRREKCGNRLENGLLRYQRLMGPLFTPTTKAMQGHDEDITLEDMADMLRTKNDHRGSLSFTRSVTNGINDTSIRLYQRGQMRAEERGLFLLDTKYEWGYINGKMVVIDEVHTPDSSRYVEMREWEEKFPVIMEEMKRGEYATVTELLKVKPELKIKEMSKQVVRDVLLEQGFDGQSCKVPRLTDGQVIETSARYIELYEKLIGREFEFERYAQPFDAGNVREYVMGL